MRAINTAFEDADAFRKMLDKVQRTDTERAQFVQRAISPEVQQWNAEVDRKRAEKKARKTQLKTRSA
jgi:hypothetical protein